MKVKEKINQENKLFSISEDDFREISDNIQMGISIVENGHYTFMNKKIREIYGIIDEEEDRTFSILDYVVPEDANKVYKIINSSLITGKIPSEIQFWIIRGDGERRCLNNKYTVFKGKEITNVHLVQTTDCTEQEITSAVLRASEKKYRAFVNSMNDAIFLSRIRGDEVLSKFVEVNDFACRMLEYSNEELVELSLLDITAPEAKKTNQETIHRIMHKEQEKFETILISKTGKKIPVEIKSHFFYLEGKRVILSTARNITDFRKIEEEIKNLNESLKMINSILRHDLNNNLSVIMESVNAYKDSKNHRFLEMTQRAAQKSFELIQKMEELERAYIHKKSPIKVDSNDLFNKVISSYLFFDVTFEIEGKCSVYVDDAFISVIDNIISNAIKHGQADKIKISINSDHGFCTIQIADNGSGILNEHKNHIFERSFKHGKTAGTGLGLFIVKKSIERYGGEITLRDNFPKGTIFEIKLKERKEEGF